MNPPVRKRLRAAWSAVRGERLIFNVIFDELNGHIAAGKPVLRFVHVHVPDDASLNGMPFREITEGSKVTL